jgi:hypothetical protein
VKVKAILLDPSCSGSGMDSLERRVEGEQRNHDKKMRQRLLSLSQFQYKALVKAFSFPQVHRPAIDSLSPKAVMKTTCMGPREREKRQSLISTAYGRWSVWCTRRARCMWRRMRWW